MFSLYKPVNTAFVIQMPFSMGAVDLYNKVRPCFWLAIDTKGFR
jgi:hypothetical protein